MGLGSGPVGTVTVDVEGDYSKLKNGLDKHGTDAGGRFGGAFKSGFGRQVANMGAAYLGANFLKGTISEASDLAESVNVTGLAFGDARKEADKFAASSAEAIGMSESATRALQAQLGNIIVGFGATQGEAAKASEDLIVRAADMGSAWNAGTDEVTEAITAAFTTSTEPIRRFGVIIDQAAIKQRALELGLISAGDELDNNSKRLAVTSLIMEQTNNVAGDFQATQDGVANSSKQVSAMWENMQASLGEALLPVLSSLLGFFKALGPEGMRLIIMGVGLTFGLIKIAQAGQALSGVFTLLAANPWVLAAVAIIAIGVAIWQNWDTVKQKGAALVGWFQGAASTIGGVFSGIANAVSAPFKTAFNAVARAWNATIGKLSVSIPSWVPVIGGKSWSAPQIPLFAGGAVLTKPTLNIAGEYAGANRNPEIVSPVDTMRATMLDALSTAGVGGGGGVTIHVGTLVVREDADIERIARELDRRRSRAAHGAGFTSARTGAT